MLLRSRLEIFISRSSAPLVVGFAVRLLLLLGFYSILRLSFYALNLTDFANIDVQDILFAFLHGIRFDISASLLTLIPLLPLWLWPPWQRGLIFSTVEIWLFVLVQALFLGMNIIDLEYVAFTGKRMSMDLLFLRGDIQRQSWSLVSYYWPLALYGLSLVVLLYMVSPRWVGGLSFEREKPLGTRKKGELLRFYGQAVVVVVLVFVGVRGGLQVKPLHPLHAYRSSHPQVGILTLNSTFTFLRSRPSEDMLRSRFFDSDEVAWNYLKPWVGLNREPLGTHRDFNVVIFILESFASEYVGGYNQGQGYTPFFDSLIAKGRAGLRNFANGRVSLQAMPPILCAIPSWMSKPIITADYGNNRMDCLAHELIKLGYQTAFFHGAHNGSMHFDNFAKRVGFEQFFGLNEFNRKDLVDGFWGALDEPFFQFMLGEIDKLEEPFFTSVFSLSSHHPYFVPEHLRGQFPKGTLEIHESIGYVDYALGQFFAEARTKPWFSRTLFVLTADHTQKSDQPQYQNLPGTFRVPLVFFSPGRELPALEGERLSQHSDILPTVLDLLGVPTREPSPFGQSVFDTSRPRRVVNFFDNGYWLIDENYYLEHHLGTGETHYFQHEGTWGLKAVDLSQLGAEKERNLNDLEVYLKSLVHHYNQGVLNNAWYGLRP